MTDSTSSSPLPPVEAPRIIRSIRRDPNIPGAACKLVAILPVLRAGNKTGADG